MPKRSAGAFQNIEDVTSEVENLEQSGFSRNDITVIASKENEENIRSLSDVKIITPSVGQSLDEDLLQSYGLDQNTIESYNTTISGGGYAILVDGEAEPGEGTLDTKNQPISSPGGGSVPPPGFGIDPRTPPSINSNLHGDPMNNREDVPISDSGNPQTEDERQGNTLSTNDFVSEDSESLNTDRTDDPIPELTNDSGIETEQSNITERPISNSETPHSPRPEEQTDIPGESLDEDRGKYE